MEEHSSYMRVLLWVQNGSRMGPTWDHGEGMIKITKVHHTKDELVIASHKCNKVYPSDNCLKSEPYNI